MDKIFDSLKKNIEKNKDIISLEKDKVAIKFNINLDVIEEEIILNISCITIIETEVMNNIKEIVIFLNEEKKNLKAEISKLKENENFVGVYKCKWNEKVEWKQERIKI